MLEDYYNTLRILINSYRLPNESNQELVNRVMNDNSIMTVLVNSEPIISNDSVLRSLLSSRDFIATL